MFCSSRGHSKTQTRAQAGFTLVEVLLSVVLLGILVPAVAGIYSTGYRSLDDQADRMVLDSMLRSRMEILIGKPYSDVSSGSEVVTVNGKSYTITWTVAGVCLDGDAIPESDVKLLTVALEGFTNRSLTAIIADTLGRVQKLS